MSPTMPTGLHNLALSLIPHLISCRIMFDTLQNFVVFLLSDSLQLYEAVTFTHSRQVKVNFGKVKPNFGMADSF
jgi:hypothetical protein